MLLLESGTAMEMADLPLASHSYEPSSLLASPIVCETSKSCPTSLHLTRGWHMSTICTSRRSSSAFLALRFTSTPADPPLLHRIRRFPVIKDLEDNDRFCEFMQGTLDKHRVVIPDLAIGFVSAPLS